MAGASKRTTVGLAVVAIIFIIVIIILCLVPDPCRRLDPRPECRPITHAKYNGTETPTERTSSSRSTEATTESTLLSSSSAGSTTESTTKGTTLIKTTTHSSTSTSTAITSTSSTDSTVASTTESTVSSTTDRSTTYLIADSTTSSTDLTTEETTTEDEDGDRAITELSTTTSFLSDSTTSSTDITMEETTAGDEDDDRAITETSTTSLTTDATDEATTEAVSEDSTSTIVEETEEETETSWSTTSTTTTMATTEETTPSETTDKTTTQETTQQGTTTEDLTKTTEVTTDITPLEDDGDVCNTKVCKEVARRMLDIMDPSVVDPCEDFYQYSCGGILDDPFLKPEDPQYPANVLIKEALERGDRDDADLKELFAVYDSCMTYSSKDAHEAFFALEYTFNPRSNEKHKDKFPPPAYSDTFDLSIALARMMKMHFTPFFDLMIDVDGDDREVFQLKMTLPAFDSAFSGDFSKAMCYGDYKAKADKAKVNGEIFDVNKNYDDYVNCTKVGDGLKTRMSNMERAVESLHLLDEFTDEVKTDLFLETKFNTEFVLKAIASVTPSPPEVKKKLRTKDYETFSVTEISKESVFGKNPINFERFISELLGQSISPDDTMIQVYFKDELKEIFSAINDDYEDQEPVMQNILMLLWAERVFNDLVTPLGPPVGSQDYCIKAVSSLMDDYVSYLYLRELPEREAIHTQIEKIIRLTKAEATDQLANSDLSCKDDFAEKLREMTGEAASFDELKLSFLEDREVLAMNESDFLQNYLIMMKNYRRRLYDLSNDESPQSVKAMWSVFQLAYKSSGVTSHSLNKFLIPYGAMNPPLYYKGVPDYINYAGIGHMIAHELMHGFDSTGTEFNYERREKMRTDKALVGPTECLGGQIQKMHFLNSSQGFNVQLKLDEKLSQNEVLSDNAAITLAWKTYERDLNNQRTPSTTTQAPTQPYRQPARRRRSAELTSYRTEYRETRRGKSLRRYRTSKRMVISEDQRLPHLEDFDPLQLYYIKTAQNLCSHTSDVNIIDAMENEHLPNRLRVNIMLGNDPQFIEAFNCPINSKMVPSAPSSGARGPCRFSPVGYGVKGRGCIEN